MKIQKSVETVMQEESNGIERLDGEWNKKKNEKRRTQKKG